MNESSESGEALLHFTAHTARPSLTLYVTIDGEEKRQRDREEAKERGRKRKRWSHREERQKYI